MPLNILKKFSININAQWKICKFNKVTSIIQKKILSCQFMLKTFLEDKNLVRFSILWNFYQKIPQSIRSFFLSIHTWLTSKISDDPLDSIVQWATPEKIKEKINKFYAKWEKIESAKKQYKLILFQYNLRRKKFADEFEENSSFDFEMLKEFWTLLNFIYCTKVKMCEGCDGCWG